MAPRKKKSNAGRPKIADPKVLVQLMIEGSLIIGQENLPFNSKNPEHKAKLNEFRKQLISPE